jgi:hypothetical protein
MMLFMSGHGRLMPRRPGALSIWSSAPYRRAIRPAAETTRLEHVPKRQPMLSAEISRLRNELVQPRRAMSELSM